MDVSYSIVMFARSTSGVDVIIIKKKHTDYLSSHGCEGVTPTTMKQDHAIDIAVVMLCLLCADDTALLSTTAADLQYNVSMFAQYCNKWKL